MELKEGDRLYCHEKFFDRINKITIVRTTKTMAIADNNLKFNKDYQQAHTGFYQKGSRSYNTPVYYLENDEWIQKYKLCKMVCHLKYLLKDNKKIKKLSLENIKKIIEILEGKD